MGICFFDKMSVLRVETEEHRRAVSGREADRISGAEIGQGTASGTGESPQLIITRIMES